MVPSVHETLDASPQRSGNLEKSSLHSTQVSIVIPTEAQTLFEDETSDSAKSQQRNKLSSGRGRP
jgi:hypothetical protein